MTRRRPMPARAAAALAAAVTTALGLAGCRPAEEGPGAILLVTLDTLRADHVSAYGDSPVPTPHLDEIAASGAIVLDARTVTPLTTPAHASILTGLYPPTHGVRNNGRFRLPDEVETLAERLAAEGFDTAAFVSAFTTSGAFGLGQGFATFDDDLGRDARGRARTQRPGDETVARAVRWLDDHAGERFFVWVHLFDPHTPYAPPPPWDERYPRDPYAGEVAHTDALVGRLLDALERTGDAARTVVVAVADHGEGLGDHGEQEHGVLLYDETLRVPWVMRAPGRIPPGTRIDAPASVVDVTPTVLGLLGLAPPTDLAGRDLTAAPDPAREAAPRAAVYAETLYPHEEFGWSALYALVRGDHKVVASTDPELYDLAADPGERRDLADTRPDLTAELIAALERTASGLIDEEMLSAAAGFEGGTDDDVLDKLASLGYVAGGGGDDAEEGVGTLPGLSGRSPRDGVLALERLDRAQQWLAAGRPGDAVKILERLVSEDPDNPQFALKLGLAYERAGRVDDAEATWRDLITRHDTFYLAYRRLSDLYEKTSRPLESRALWLRLRARMPGYVGLETRLARAEIAAGLAADAARRMSDYVDRRPDDAEGWELLARARAALGEADAAAEAYRRSLALDPDRTEAREALEELERNR